MLDRWIENEALGTWGAIGGLYNIELNIFFLNQFIMIFYRIL